jgi:hypothetical protein
MSRMRILAAIALAASLTLSAAFAQRQQEPAQRLNGTIERVMGNFVFAAAATAARSRSSLPTMLRSLPC